MKRSHGVRLGLTVALGAALLSQTAAACDEGPEEFQEQNSAYGEICMKYNRATGEYDVRVPDEECDNDPDRRAHTWIWINQAGGYHPPPVGSKVSPGTYVTTKPTGTTISRPPATGGFGTFRAPIGG